MEAEQRGRSCGSRCAWPALGASASSRGEGVEVVVGELVEVLARGQAEQAEPAAGHVAGPVGAPAEPLGHLDDAGDVVGVARRPLLVEVAGLLGEQEIEVGSQVAFDETPGQERTTLRCGAGRRAGRVWAGSSTRRGCGWTPSSRGGRVAPQPLGVRARWAGRATASA